jgi:hypothetical protein
MPGATQEKLAEIKQVKRSAAMPEDFVLFKDGPVAQWLRHVPALRPIVDSPVHRVLIAVTITWVPLLVLSILGGLAFGGAALPFFKDFQTQIRMLVSLPLYIIGAHVAHRITRGGMHEFVARGIVREKDRAKFKSIQRAASGWNHSLILRLAIIAAVAVAGPMVWAQGLASRQVSAWYGETGASGTVLTLAGYWLVWVANPIFQYLHLLWAVRLLMYAVTLARIAMLNLYLVATHPDRAGGIGFLGERVYGFVEFVTAEGAAVAGVLANRIFHEGRSLGEFKLDILGTAILVTVMVFGPMCVFIPRLFRARRLGQVEYGEIANRYVREFEKAWVWGKARSEGRQLLGAADVQSLADMAHSFDIVDGMRPVPFSNRVVIGTLVSFLLPIAPLLLTVIPAEQLLDKIIHSFVG